MDGPGEKIGAFDWEGLEGRFWDRMEECRGVEEGVGREFEELVQVCLCGGGFCVFFLAVFRPFALSPFRPFALSPGWWASASASAVLGLLRNRGL